MIKILKPDAEQTAHFAVGAAGDEPVLVLRGRHVYAVHLLHDFAARCESVGMPKLAEKVRSDAADLQEWQKIHGVEYPSELEDRAPKKK